LKNNTVRISPNKCAECGDELARGDTVYTLLGMTFCSSCVKYGRHIHMGESMGDSHLIDRFTTATDIDDRLTGGK
jgi:hypothetical protein